MRDHPPQRVPAAAAMAAVLAVVATAGAVTLGAAPVAGRHAFGPLAEGTATPTPDPSPGFCRVLGRQSAIEPVVERGRPAGLEISLSAECPQEARGRSDILLVVDHSSSMREGGKYEGSAEAVRLFVEGVDFARHRAGLVLFNERSWVAQPLTDRPDRILSAFTGSGLPIGGTDIALALSTAESELDLRGRVEAVPIIVLMTDGQSAVSGMVAAAERSRQRGTVVFAIGLGDDAAHAALGEVATTPEHYYYAPGPELLGEIYQRIAEMIRAFSVTNVTLRDEHARAVTYVTGSARPDEPSTNGPLAWRRAFLLPEPTVIAYSVRIDRLGLVVPSARVWVEYTDGDGVLRRADIEPVELEVVEPEIHLGYLPLAVRSACRPIRAWTDVVLAVDVSSSMAGDKLARAVVAAKAFVRMLELPGDRAAIVQFDETAHLAQMLTADLPALERALDGMAPGEGTRLDRGLEAAVAELIGPRRREGSRLAIVLLSDGRQVDEAALAHAWAQYAWSLDVAVFTIALGDDADRALLRGLADRPSHAYWAPGPEELERIYRELAGTLRCR